MTRIAVPHWQGRISPVFDVARRVLVVEMDAGAEKSRRDESFDMDDPFARAARLVETGARLLICGAISRPLEAAVAAGGVEVIARVCGEVESVLAAWREGRLGRATFRMPGCHGRRRLRCGRGMRRGRAFGHE